MAQWGIQPDPGLIHTGIETDVQRIDALEAVLERRPDCILCGDDRLAFDVLAGAAGPSDPGVAGSDAGGQPLRQRADRRAQPRHFGPYSLNAEALGGAACRMLRDLMAGKESSRQVVMGHQVILRDSTKMTPGL